MKATFTSRQRQKNPKVQNTQTKGSYGVKQEVEHTAFPPTRADIDCVLIHSPTLDEGYLDVQRTDPRPEPNSALLMLLSQSSTSVLLVTCDNPGEINICLFIHSFIHLLRPHRLVEHL